MQAQQRSSLYSCELTTDFNVPKHIYLYDYGDNTYYFHNAGNSTYTSCF